MKKIILSLVVSALVMSSAAFAGGYKSAGCGLGSLLIKDDGFLQIFAATTNYSFYSQLFGITSGTSNCGGSGGYAKSDVEQEMYVSANWESISQEMAQGNGEHLNALASLLGCEKASVTNFTAFVHKNYRNIVKKDTTPEQFLSSVKSQISTEPTLAKACERAS